ncbi:MAG: HEPN domain-containing protein [Chloroflexota bacterium]
MIHQPNAFLLKAQEALAGAEVEFESDRFNNCANRCYYACFQAAIYALIRAGVPSLGKTWTHQSVQAQFIGLLINRRKLFPAELRETLHLTQSLREVGDYAEMWVTRRDASRSLRVARAFVEAVQIREGEGS